MKNFLQNHSSTNQARIFTALILTGILSLGNELTLLKSATAAPTNLLPETAKEVLKGNTTKNGLPRPVASAVLRDLSRREQIPTKQLQIIQYSQRTWRNGCLELPKPNELCTQALVPGWQVVVSNNSRKWTYHTNSNGRSLRLANADTPTKNPSENLPKSLTNAVFKDASKRLDLPVSRLNIIQAQQRTWSNGCLDLPKAEEGCTRGLVAGWRLVVGTPEQTLVYHTDGRAAVRLNEKASEITQNNLPSKISNAVLSEASKFTGLTTPSLRIVKAEQITTDGCLSLPRLNEACTQIGLKAWKVTVQGEKQRLVFHAHPNAKDVRLNVAASRISLPKPVADAVLQKAREVSSLSTKALKIVDSKRTQWSYGCDRPTPGNACDPVLVSGWQVTVGALEDSWVFLTDESGSQIKLSQKDNQTPQANLPKSIANAILAEAAEKSKSPTTKLRIVEVERKQWSDSCLGIGEPQVLCATTIVPGWRVTVSDGQQRLVYRVGEPNTIKFDKQASQIAEAGVQPQPIPKNELPPSLDSGVVFRQIETGGFAGRTYETVLRDDGILTRVRIGDANDSERSVRRVSPQLVQQFQQLLKRQADEFKNLSYPAAGGAADYITYTLTSRNGSVQYNDISNNSLSEDLRSVIKAWNQIRNSATDLGSTLEPQPIPTSQLPPSLDSGIVFQQINSGGFVGRTYKTVLRNDGILTRVRMGDANDSERSVRRVSPELVQQFQQLLKSQADEFKNLSYPASGGADYITYTFTSPDGTVQYNDISQKSVSEDLRSVIQAWNRIASSAQ